MRTWSVDYHPQLYNRILVSRPSSLYARMVEESLRAGATSTEHKRYTTRRRDLRLRAASMRGATSRTAEGIKH